MFVFCTKEEGCSRARRAFFLRSGPDFQFAMESEPSIRPKSRCLAAPEGRTAWLAEKLGDSTLSHRISEIEGRYRAETVAWHQVSTSDNLSPSHNSTFPRISLPSENIGGSIRRPAMSCLAMHQVDIGAH